MMARPVPILDDHIETNSTVSPNQFAVLELIYDFHSRLRVPLHSSGV